MNSQLTTHNSQLRTLFLGLLIIISQLITQNSELLYGQDDYLKATGNVKADSVDFDTFTGDTGGKPSAPVEGEVFYDFEAGKNQPYYYDGALPWKTFGGAGPKTAATKVVAASDSQGTTGCPGACANPRADYVCDGTADQTEIQAAIDALGANGGAVYLLEGTYNISGSINLDNTAPDDSGKAIIGTGKGSVLKVTTGASNVNVLNASNVNRILISQLMIDGNNKTGSNNNGIYFNTVTSSKIDKVWVENMKVVGMGFSSSTNNTISGNNIRLNNSYGIYFTSSSSNNIISGNNIQDGASSSAGIFLEVSSNSNIIFGNNIQSNGTGGIILMPSNNNAISGNNIQLNGGFGGILLFPGDNNTISANNIRSNDYGIWNYGSNNTISGNNVSSNTYQGFRFASGNNNAISGNIISDNGGSGNYDGINISGNNNLISSNRISDSSGTGFGINITSGATNNYLTGNLIDGAGYTNRLINDSGTTTKHTDKTKMTLEKKEIGGISGNYTLGVDITTNPRTYISFNPTGAVILALATGKASGDLLILENIHATNSVSLSESANVNLGASPRNLGQYDTLELIWNGSKWLEVKYTDN